MSEYIALYECKMCGEMQRVRETVEGSRGDIEALLAKTLAFQDHFGTRPDLNQLRARIPHRCVDGSLGVSVFAGFKKISKGE